jgi:hypothetical protein
MHIPQNIFEGDAVSFSFTFFRVFSQYCSAADFARQRKSYGTGLWNLCTKGMIAMIAGSAKTIASAEIGTDTIFVYPVGRTKFLD